MWPRPTAQDVEGPKIQPAKTYERFTWSHGFQLQRPASLISVENVEAPARSLTISIDAQRWSHKPTIEGTVPPSAPEGPP